jgi:hypothetical protein
VPIAVENVSSYAEFHISEMTEWQFLNEVVERADCGILLDVNNIYVSSRNHNFDPYDYLNAVPAERVAQIHIAGHSKFEKYILDTHDHPVIDPVWKLYEHAIRKIGATPTLLEWDDRIPGTASNAVLKRKAGGLVRRIHSMPPEHIFLAVHRLDFTVFYRRLDAEEFHLLAALGKGLPVGKAMEGALEDSPAPVDELRRRVETWFAAWAEMGWLCSQF